MAPCVTFVALWQGLGTMAFLSRRRAADAHARSVVRLDAHGIGVDGLCRDEPDTLPRVRLEHAIDHDDMQVFVLAQR